MNPDKATLPNYFLADLPKEATLSAAMIGEACQTLKRNRARYLEERTTESRIALLGELARNWLNPEDRFRQLALEEGPAASSFSRPTLEAGLNAFFKQLTPENLHDLLEQDLGHARRLDDFVSAAAERASGRASVATAPELLVHITSGNLPSPALLSIVLGVLIRSAQFVKCASGCSWLPRLFAHSLYEAEPKLGACLEIAEWPGGNLELETAIFEQAGCVTATGSDEALAAIRQRVPARVRFLGYGHRVSFAFVARPMLSGTAARKTAELAAADVAAWNQLGCLSPHVIYVEKAGALHPEQFAQMLADELARREESEPRGQLPPEAAAAIASRRSLYQVRAAHSPDTVHWCSFDSTAWTVVYEADARFQLSCLNRFIYVKGVESLTQALQHSDHIRNHISTVGLAAPEESAKALAKELARWGATRVCPLGQMQNPPLTWRHDGRPSLADLLTWTDWESGAL
jgi:Acyl-CoA reductase (LuxC)